MGVRAHPTTTFEASIERQASTGRYMLRILVDDLRVEYAGHATLEEALATLELRLLSGWYSEVDVFLVGGAVCNGVDAALEHVRGMSGRRVEGRGHRKGPGE
jgi:hypothetical protein